MMVMGVPEKFSHKIEHIDDDMLKIEVNLDDMPAEWMGYVMELLFDAGANDVFYTPIYMKKNRPGILLQVLCSASILHSLKTLIFKETTTLGIRIIPISVHRLERQFKRVETPWGEVSIKLGLHNGDIVQQAPEYEDCKRIAEQNHIPLKQVYQTLWSLLEMPQN